MKSLIEYLDCGNIYKNVNWIDFTVGKYEDLVLKVIPFFD